MLFVAPGRVQFDPSNQWMYMQSDGLYTYPNWEKHMDLPYETVFFDTNWQYMFIPEVGLHDIATRELIFPSTGDRIVFSQSS